MNEDFKFKLGKEEIKHLAIGFGACYATDMITIEGKKINFMYRENPDFENDSGWRFFSGYESEEYLNNPSNTKIYDVNSITNYDEDIIPHLKSPYGTAFERNKKTLRLEQIFDFEFPE